MNATHVHRAGVWLISPIGHPYPPGKRGRVYIFTLRRLRGRVYIDAPPLAGRARVGARGVVMELKSKSLVQERFGAFAATYATSPPMPGATACSGWSSWLRHKRPGLRSTSP